MEHKRSRRDINADRETGFTVIELIVIITIVGILAVVAIVKFSDTSAEKIQATAQRIISDIGYAQHVARTGTQGTKMNFYSTGEGGGGGGEGCFVATVCYGQNSPHVSALRGYRDRILRKSRPGRAFVRWYYREGPAIAKEVKQNPVLTGGVRALLLPVALLAAPFAGEAYAFGGGGDDGGGVTPGDPNTYSIRYIDNSDVAKPQGGNQFVVDLGEVVTITSPDSELHFDTSGKMSVVSYSWGSSQTNMIACTLNDAVNIRVARFTGKAWVD